MVGTYDGRCIFYNTEELKYFTQIHVRSTRGKNAKGRKISGIEPAPGEDKVGIFSGFFLLLESVKSLNVCGSVTNF